MSNIIWYIFDESSVWLLTLSLVIYIVISFFTILFVDLNLVSMIAVFVFQLISVWLLIDRNEQGANSGL